MNSSRRNPAFRDPALIEPGDPYQELLEIGVHYDCSMSELHRACQNAQQRQLLTAERVRAWAELRNAESRVLLDLLHVVPQASQGGVEPGTPPLPAPDRIPGAPPELLLALTSELVAGQASPVRAPMPETPSIDVWSLLEEQLSKRDGSSRVEPTWNFLPEKS